MSGDGTSGGVPTWRVNRAVRASDLDPPSRLIMFVLSDIADNSTAEVPPQRTPSTRQLMRETGYGETTVKRHRTALEKAGWLIVTRPTAAESVRHVRIKYRLAIPAQGVHRAHEERIREIAQTIEDPTAGVHNGPSTGFAVDPPLGSLWTPGESTAGPMGVQSEPPQGPERTPMGVRSGPSKEDVPTDVPDYQKPPAVAGGREERLAIAEELTEKFWDRHGIASAQRKPAVRAVIITAVADNSVPRDDAAHALDALARAGKQITSASLTDALGRLRPLNPARAPAPPAPPKPPRRLCQIHPAVELTEHGMCTSCAGDAKAGRDDLDLDEPLDPAHIPTPRRALYAVPPTDHESRSA